MADDSLNCASCGAANPGGARFCNQCGARLQAQAGGYTPRHLQATLAQSAGLQGERKRVTVLFADIKGSTRLAEQAGAELWHEVLDRFFGILARQIHAYDGTINQYTGDGVMALFGAPRALEDHAGHAARAALEMQREVRRYADELRLSHGLNLTMRVGLNSGEVVVGRIGDDLRSDYTAQGATVNLAARMEQICEPGRIYVARATAALLEGYFRLRPLGATEVAGVGAAVEVFELEAADGLRTRLQRSLARTGSPFIGRDPELSRLLAALDAVRAGQGQVLAVVGNAGLGKSRLCHEFAEACVREGIAVHRATGVPYASRVPMFPVRQLLRARLGVPDNAAPDEARRWIAGALLLEDAAHAATLPHVFDFLGLAAAQDRPPDSGPEAQARMLDQLARYLPCGSAPRVLLVEDLHFADAATEQFLLRLCETVRSQPCLLLLNYRPDYPSEWLQPRVDETIALSALQAEELRTLAGTLLGPDASVAGVAGVLAERAGGNPYFVEEAVLALADGGWLQGRPRAWRLVRPVEDWPVPDSVQALLAARIDRLPEAPRQRLQAAAVVGQQFDLPLLAALDGAVDGAAGDRAASDSAARASVERDVEVLEELGFVHRSDENAAAFCHPLVQEVAYRGQLESSRRAVHLRLAALLEARHGGADAPPQELALRVAHHWQRGGALARAGHWNLIAARWALTHYAPVAHEQCRRALANFDAAPESAEVHRGRISARAALIRLASLVSLSAPEVEALYHEARQLAEDCGDVFCRAELLMSWGNELQRRGCVDAAARGHEEAIELCFAHGRLDLINRFRLSLLLSFNAAGRLRRVVEILDAAGGDWRARPVDEENYLSRGFYGLMLGWLGRLDEAAAHLDAAIDYAQRSQRAASWMYVNRVDLALLSGDFSQALPAAQQALERAEVFGSAYFRAIALRGQGLALSLNGRHAEALAALEAAAPMVAEDAPAHQFEANHMATQAFALLAAGDESAAEAMARRAQQSARSAGSRIWEIFACLVWLKLPAAAARRAAAQVALRRVAELLDETGAEGFRPWLLHAQAHWSQDPESRRARLGEAEAAYRAVGARGYAERLAGERAGGWTRVSESA